MEMLPVEEVSASESMVQETQCLPGLQGAEKDVGIRLLAEVVFPGGPDKLVEDVPRGGDIRVREVVEVA